LTGRSRGFSSRRSPEPIAQFKPTLRTTAFDLGHRQRDQEVAYPPTQVLKVAEKIRETLGLVFDAEA
jgi:hypothetical protein